MGEQVRPVRGSLPAALAPLRVSDRSLCRARHKLRYAESRIMPSSPAIHSPNQNIKRSIGRHNFFDLSRPAVLAAGEGTMDLKDENNEREAKKLDRMPSSLLRYRARDNLLALSATL